MTLLERVLDPPSYGYWRNGGLYVPTHRELFAEFFSRLNIFTSRRNWLPLWGWTMTLAFGVPLAFFLVYHATFKLMLVGFVYSMVLMGSHGTFWLHRYSTHRAFKFQNRWVRLICRNLVLKVVPEEVYVVSHYVHHHLSEQPGDPYNAHGGWLYCFLADVNHQAIARDLSSRDYEQVSKLLSHTGMHINTYAQYLRWGSVCHPAWTIAHYVLNWAGWYGIFYVAGGHALATALFGWAGVWAIGIRTFNYEGHGRGQDRRREGSDFCRSDFSINQAWPGFVAGEWHNNHHLYPNSARSGFLGRQLDLPWYFVRFLKGIGAVSSFRDNRADFMRDHYLPWSARAASNASISPRQPV